MTAPIPEPHFAQVALSVADMPSSLRFYSTVLGFRSAAGRFSGGANLARVQGLPDPFCVMWWLTNEQPFFQLELFQYDTPSPAPRPAGWRPSDIGYGRLTFAVGDLDATLARAAALSAPILAPATAVEGTRRACLLDPTGIPVELVEDARLGEAPARFAAMGASVPSIADARTWFQSLLGMPAADPPNPDREALWGLPGADRTAECFRAGAALLEVAEYQSPAPTPRSKGWLINGHGILNLALGYRDWGEFHAAYQRVTAAGFRSETEPLGAGGAYDVSYCMDPAGFSVELLYVPESSDRMLGFLPEAPLTR